jgi:hypothetical protein
VLCALCAPRSTRLTLDGRLLTLDGRLSLDVTLPLDATTREVFGWCYLGTGAGAGAGTGVLRLVLRLAWRLVLLLAAGCLLPRSQSLRRGCDATKSLILDGAPMMALYPVVPIHPVDPVHAVHPVRTPSRRGSRPCRPARRRLVARRRRYACRN